MSSLDVTHAYAEIKPTIERTNSGTEIFGRKKAIVYSPRSSPRITPMEATPLFRADSSTLLISDDEIAAMREADCVRAEAAEKEVLELKKELMKLKAESIRTFENIGGSISEDKAAWEHSVVFTVLTQQKHFDELQMRMTTSQTNNTEAEKMLRQQVATLTDQNAELMRELKNAQPGGSQASPPLSAPASPPQARSTPQRPLASLSPPRSAYFTPGGHYTPGYTPRTTPGYTPRATSMSESAPAAIEAPSAALTPLQALRARGRTLEGELRVESMNSPRKTPRPEYTSSRPPSRFDSPRHWP